MVLSGHNFSIYGAVRKTAVVLVSLLLGLTATQAYAEVKIFLEIDGGKVAGESTNVNHEGEIEVLAWSWGLSNNASMHAGAGRSSGRAHFQDLAITKFIDKSTAKLLEHAASGRQFNEATLTVQKPGEMPLDYIVIKMTKVLVSSFQQAGSEGEDRLTENVTLNFAEVDFKYVEQNDTGEAGAAHEVGWDIAANKPK